MGARGKTGPPYFDQRNHWNEENPEIFFYHDLYFLVMMIMVMVVVVIAVLTL